jgi:chromosome segregation ATPase
MNAETHQPESPAASALPPGEPSPKGLVNPKLTGTLAADHAALQNDLVQAQELAQDFQRQLAGKSNEHAQLKQILEKTQTDLAHLQGGIEELRAERHRLANEAMRATAFEFKLEKMSAERDRLRADIEVVRQAMGSKIDEMVIQLRDRDRRVAELVIETVALRRAVDEARAGAAPAPAARRAVAVQAQEDEEEPDVEISR